MSLMEFASALISEKAGRPDPKSVPDRPAAGSALSARAPKPTGERDLMTGTRRMDRLTAFALCSLALLAGSPATAATKTFKLERGTVKMDVPEEWQDAEDLFGMPLMLLGPETTDRRPVITVTPTGMDGISLDPKDVAANQEDYKAHRKEWLEQYEGKALNFFPYEAQKWAGVSEAHAMGYRYTLKSPEGTDTEFVERSYYVVCKNKLYHLKSLVTATQEKAHGKEVERTVRSFTCE
jgi:hypothetical protein